MKRKNGEYIGAFVAYGYMKDPQNKNRLVIDEYAAGVVRDIFDMKQKGMSQHSIATKLNKDGVLSPLEYMRSRGINLDTPFRKKTKAKWSHSSVLRILQNEMYTGTLIQGKTGTPNYKIKKRTPKAEENWVRIEGAFEPIIAQKDFELVQDLLMRDTRIPPEGEKLYPFSGTVFCADCGAPMVRKIVKSGGREYVYFICSGNKNDKSVCSSHRIPENVLGDAVLTAVAEHIDGILVLEEALRIADEAPMKAAEIRKFEERIEMKESELEQLKKRKLHVYEDLKDGILSSDEYEMLKSQYGQQIAECEGSLEGLRIKRQDALDDKTEQHIWIEDFKKYQGIQKLSRNDVIHMIERIEVSDAKRIEVKFRFIEDYLRLLEQVMDETGSLKEAI